VRFAPPAGSPPGFDSGGLSVAGKVCSTGLWFDGQVQ
jgi:hypothetical protein